MEKRSKTSLLLRVGSYVLLVLTLILNVILFSLKSTQLNLSIWQTASFISKSTTCIASTVLVFLFVIQGLLLLVSIILIVMKKKVDAFVACLYGLVFACINLVLSYYAKVFKNAQALIIITIITSLLALILLISAFFIKDYKPRRIEFVSRQMRQVSQSTLRLRRIILFALSTFSVLLLISLFFIPFFSRNNDGKVFNYILANFKSATNTDDIMLLNTVLTVILALFMGNLVYYLFSIGSFLSNGQDFLKKSRNIIGFSLAITFIFFGIGYFVSFYYNVINVKASFGISYIPLLLVLICAVFYSFIAGRYKEESAVDSGKASAGKPFKLSPLVFIIILTGVTFLSLVFNVIEIKMKVGSLSNNIKLSGFNLLKQYGTLGGGFQVLAFVLYVFMLASAVLLFLTLVSFFSKSKDYYKFVKISAFSNVIFMFILGMSGIYYQISQKINEDNILSLITSNGGTIPLEYTYKIQTQTLYVFIISLAVFAVMMACKQLETPKDFSDSFELKMAAGESFSNSISAGESISPLPAASNADNSSDSHSDPSSSSPRLEQDKSINSFDACPAFTEIDQKIHSFETDLNERKLHEFEEVALPELVGFIVDYARESRLHLSYSREDIASFIAGLGASRLAILQGMSGTGKTSLPKIFMEALDGRCEIIEVESSWRDKNELLGYYNEFSRSFTPKKFTQCLYKAKLNPEIPTFIVLDEMNLSRIEYYFSDFLSLMENEEENRQIKLLNVKLYRCEDYTRHEYLGLENGHTLRIPPNVWFIGTANRDESTFEISDKVYDRALTMNFNKRAPKIRDFTHPIESRFLSYPLLAELLTKAKAGGDFDAESNRLIQETEKLLQPYNISFGNRVLKQMEDFVNIYCACFSEEKSVLNQAIEKVLLSKVVSKLEFKNVDNKEELIEALDGLELYHCSAFVKKLAED